MRNPRIPPGHKITLTGALKVRRCLRCGETFPSTAKGYRTCGLCRRRKVSVDEQMLVSWER